MQRKPKPAVKPRTKKSARPFRGPTPENVYQTIDIGAGEGADYIWKQASKFTRRHYLGIDPRLSAPEAENLALMKMHANEALDKLIARGTKTRHINMHLPLGELIDEQYFRGLVRKAKNILLPNGKIFLACDTEYHTLYKILEDEGFSLRPKIRDEKDRKYFFAFLYKRAKKMHPNEFSPAMAAVAADSRYAPLYYQIEATLGLKEAKRMQNKK